MIEGNYTELVKECYDVAKQKIEETSDPKISFHNWEHTENVFTAITEIASNTKDITEEQIELLQIASLFHDITSCIDHKDHEIKSAELATDFLQEKKIADEKIDFVKKLILATKLSHKPENVYESIIKDADLNHLSKGNYIYKPFINLFKEISNWKNLTPNKWVEECIIFFDQNKYYTEYAIENYNPGKKKNKTRLIELSKMNIESLDDLVEETKKFKKKPNKKKADKSKPDKGVETMFRIELRNHVTLSRIADDKANTLISVNAIIISIVLSTLFPKLDNNPYLTLPAIFLVTSSITTIIISIISTIPRTTHGILSREDVIKRRGNIVFFGNFHKMNLDDFEWSIDELLNDKDYLYKTLTRDLYYLGKVLNKKYSYLRTGYITFVAGLIVSIIIFMVKIFANYNYIVQMQ